MGVTEADVITGSRGTGSETGPALGYLVARDCPSPGSKQPRAGGQGSLKLPYLPVWISSGRRTYGES